jgi:predicted outer membrane repeat protein
VKANVITCCCVLGVLAGTAAAGTVRVNWDGSADHATISEGITAAAQGDTVLVAPGTYAGPLNRDISFGGKDVYLLSEAGYEATIIDCDGQGRGFVIVGNEPPTTTVEGFTIKDGVAPMDGSEIEGWGGGLYCANSSPAILGCRFVDCEAGYGGAMYCGVSAIMSIVSCVFDDNRAEHYGGGIYTYGAAVDIAKCDFTGGEAGISGGAVCCKTGTLVYISDCDFIENIAPDGGAVYIGTFDNGGTEPEDPSRVYYSRFLNNYAGRGGGLFINGFTWVNAAGCVFEYNTAAKYGGAVYALTDYTRSLTVNNCTFCFNGALHGGSVYSAGGFGFEMSIAQSIFAFGTGGAAVQAEDYNSVAPTLCLAYGNTGGDALPDSRNIQVDPLFCGVYEGNYYLCDNSPCLADNHPYGFALGAHTAPYTACEACAAPVEEVSWGSIKAMYR